ncbi:MAG: methylenetetrahydrofolate reductase [Clostridiales bacterium]|jgi:methylenetetrahydrofolate reductase (NADPH)|nr:methylenetetrahydrofolate reductase [Clostridiales bacterium]
MRISRLIDKKKTALSFEIFPPKADMEIDIDGILNGLAGLKPDFISVTNSAGGNGATDGTLDIAEKIKNRYNTESIMHLVCSGASKQSIRDKLSAAYERGIDNILALRGDKANAEGSDFYYAEDLIKAIDGKKFCIGAAAYPEGHIDAPDLNTDLDYLKRKADCGVDFLTTQLCYDNNLLFKFRDLARKKGITAPILYGIMPVISKSQVSRMIFMCGVSLPGEIVKILYRYENNQEDLLKAGIDYAAKQINGLIQNGADGIHIYTMNKPDIAGRIVSRLDNLY